MSDARKDIMDLIPHYLDGSLTEAQRARFETELANDAEFRAEFERHRAVDEAIRRRFTPPTSDELMRWVDDLPEESVPTPRRSRVVARSTMRWQRPAAFAASLAVAAFGVWMILNATGVLGPDQTGPYGPKRTITQAWNHVNDSGFRPTWVCEDDAEFRATFYKHYRQPLSFVEQEDVALIGLTYANLFSGRTTGVMGQAEGENIVVYVDHHTAVPDSIDVDDGLFMYRKRLGDLVLVEISPIDHPIMIDAFYTPDGLGSRSDGTS